MSPLTRRPARRFAALLLAATAFGLGTAVPASASSPDGSIGRGEVLDRAQSWVDAQVPYNNVGCYPNQYGCYRPDCSGYVSMAWNLSSALDTWHLWNVTSDIAAGDLQPGDALLRDSGGTDHVALFVRWADAAHTQPVVREEIDYGYVAQEDTWTNGLRGFSPRRYNQLDDLIPYGTIGVKYAAMGGGGSVLGAPITGERDSSLGGRFQQFQNGIILWHPDDAHPVYGDILRTFWATDAERHWGFPTTDEADAAAAPNGTRGRYQFFEHGLFLWSAATGTHEIHDAIYDAFAAGGREAKLGYPTGDEVDENGGRAQHFQNATIHWNPSQGTWITT
ncbi:hypothetical protein CFP65_4890 [Kitasatospora sp. MMS16-BH015]|uniref:hypothetical protein n=1 Tax=Kitasatospora sp. MMS16-BH015 TaxID=2018025 RepID=UPI000CA1BE1D|nr:hypothetical protein [Kitasatospora sp. MMS16-BH015]AUG79608.1 hypothetical protein CFP65_4890 [Kitasatospora sp. MMS16-BH015]